MTTKPNIYLDTSVINFLFADDAPERKQITVDFFQNFIRSAVYQTFISTVVLEEINNTKNEQKRTQLLSVVDDYPLEFAALSATNEITALSDLYVANGIIPVKKKADALLIAITVVNRFDYLVSWNFQHLANVNREQRVLILNQQNNYLHPFRIITPLQLMDADF